MSDEREKTATAKVINLLLKREDTLLREWHPTLNDSLTPETVTYGSHYKVWWTCGEGDGCEPGGKKENGLPRVRRCGKQGENAALSGNRGASDGIAVSMIRGRHYC